MVPNDNDTEKVPVMRNPKHLVIPDTQVSPGVNTDHLEALGRYIVRKLPDVIIHIGDHYDMPSLSSYDRAGGKRMEGRRYLEDIQAGNAAMDRLMAPIHAMNIARRRSKVKLYKPRLVFLLGNHENRINRACENEAKLDGVLSADQFNLRHHGWEVHDFLEIVNIDGINYSHYFVNPTGLAALPIGGSVDNKLKHLGCSFTMGHQQHFQYGIKYGADGTEVHGLVAGAFYSHDEEYLGPQKNRQYWRGVILKNDVHNGTYDICKVSLNYLLRRYGNDVGQ